MSTLAEPRTQTAGMDLHHWQDQLSGRIVSVTPGSPADQLHGADRAWIRVIPIPAPADVQAGDAVGAARALRQITASATAGVISAREHLLKIDRVGAEINADFDAAFAGRRGA